MLNRTLCLIMLTLPGLMFALALEAMLPVRKNRISRWQRIFLWIFLFLISAFAKTFISLSMATTFLNLGFVLLGVLFSVRFFYEGSLFQKIGAMLTLLFALISAELVILPVSLLLKHPQFSMDYSQRDMVIVCLAGSVTSFSAIFLTSGLWKKLKLRQNMPRGSWMTALTSIVLILPAMLSYREVLHSGGKPSGSYMLSMFLVYLLSLLMIWLQFHRAERELLETELTKLQSEMKLEQQHYSQLEAHQQELSRIRHDYNNHLTAIAGLLQLHQTGQALQAVESLLGRIAETKECAYCGIPIVNAILSEKAGLCRSSGIGLHAELLLPDGIGIDPLDLCSVFSNVLDNAIHACQTLPDQTCPQILLRARIQGNFLAVCCENPSAEPTGKPSGTGIGLKILKEIAQRWDGSLETEYADGTFTARMVLSGTRHAKND